MAENLDSKTVQAPPHCFSGPTELPIMERKTFFT